MDIADVTAISGIIYLLLSIKQQPWCWPIGIFSVSLWFWLAFEGQLYMDACLQLIYVGLGFYGWHQWLKGNAGQPLRVRRIRSLECRSLLSVIGLGTVVFGLLSAHVWHADYPWLDSFTTLVCLAAQYLTTKKVLESWIFWIIGDGIYIWLYSAKGWNTLAFLMVAYTVLAFVGLYKWYLDEKQPAESNQALCPSRG